MTDEEIKKTPWKTWSKMIDAQAEKDRTLIIRREELRKEYWQKVENGEFRPPTRNEKLIATANGCPDNECTIAARKLLNKKGIDWRQFKLRRKQNLWL